MTGPGCGCCVDGRHVQPTQGTWNAPGRRELDRRIAHYPDALDRMIARLSDAGRPALAHLTTRDPSDPSIALLDAWACLEDVITFYEERIANEGYLRTATDRDALAGIAALVGYRPRPGVAASTLLAFEMEPGHDARLEAGQRVRSVPKPGEEAQTFESVEDLEARFELNALRPQQRRPQVIPFDEALTVETIWLQGSITLAPGDPLLLYFDETPGHQVLRMVVEAKIEQELTDQGLGSSRTRVRLALVHPTLQDAFLRLKDDADGRVAAEATHLALGAGAAELVDAMQPTDAGDDPFKEVRGLLEGMLKEPADDSRFSRIAIEPVQLLDMLRPHRVAPGRADVPPANGNDDRAARLVSSFTGVPIDRLRRAWQASEEAIVSPEGALVFALRRVVGLFGHNSPPQLVGQGKTREWELASDEDANVLHLEARIPDLAPGSHLVIRSADATRLDVGKIRQEPVRRLHRIASAVTTINRSAYSLGGLSTRVDVAPAWWSIEGSEGADEADSRRKWMEILRGATVYCASERLDLADELDETPLGPCQVLADIKDIDVLAGPVGEPSGDRIRLDHLVAGLEPGRTVVVTGTRAASTFEGYRSLDVPASEVATVVAVTHDTESDRPDGPTRTTIWLSAPLQQCYVRSSVRVLANVVPATHGETRIEILGSGDARAANQTFRTQPGQLTFVASDDEAGVSSTLEVRVDDVRWLEVDPAAEPGPADHIYTASPAGTDRTLVRFGDGVEGARPRTGQQNVRARYRVGIGPEANLDAESITTLVTRPLGLKGVRNPVSATGGAGPDGPDAIRERAPIEVSALGRLVSVQDHAEFALGFAGVAKSVATRLPIAGRSAVHVTIAGPEDAPIDGGSVLIRRLVRAFRAYGDPLVPVRVEPGRRTLLALVAQLRLLPDHRWSEVEPRVRGALLRRFGFVRRSLGQDALLSEVIATAQACAGVDYVDIDGWGVLDPQDMPMSLGVMAKRLSDLVAPPAGTLPAERLVIPPAVVDSGGTVVSAAIAYFDPKLPETLLLKEAPDGR